MKQAPRYKFGTNPRVTVTTLEGPGPGAYEAFKTVGDTSIKKTMGIVLKLDPL